MITSCFFTGHRILMISDNLTKRLTAALKDLIERGVKDFYAGGAMGFDMLCEKTVLSLKEDYPHIKLHLVLPCPPEEQCARWIQEQKAEYCRIYDLADSVELTSDTYFDGCMKKRNARLTELGDTCVCYWDHGFHSGTYQTIRMAMEKGMVILNLYKG